MNSIEMGRRGRETSFGGFFALPEIGIGVTGVFQSNLDTLECVKTEAEKEEGTSRPALSLF